VSNNSGLWLFGKRKDFTIINNAIDLDRFTFDNSSRSFIRKSLGIEKNLVIGHVGIFNSTKNQIMLIDLINELVLDFPSMILVLIGDGILRFSVEEKIKSLNLQENVLFLGMVNDTSKYYSAFDMLIMPSIYEGYPNVVLEAQVNGLPVLVSDTITNEIEVSDDIYFISLLDKYAWLERIKDIANRKQSRKIDHKLLTEKIVTIENEKAFLENLYDIL
jgi:glycosyltransferase involved in cell wall biosynthesis